MGCTNQRYTRNPSESRIPKGRPLRDEALLCADAKRPLRDEASPPIYISLIGRRQLYADWDEFDADLDKWEAERAARKELMAERHEAQQRVFRAKHPRLVSR